MSAAGIPFADERAERLWRHVSASLEREGILPRRRRFPAAFAAVASVGLAAAVLMTVDAARDASPRGAAAPPESRFGLRLFAVNGGVRELRMPSVQVVPAGTRLALSVTNAGTEPRMLSFATVSGSAVQWLSPDRRVPADTHDLILEPPWTREVANRGELELVAVFSRSTLDEVARRNVEAWAAGRGTLPSDTYALRRRVQFQ